MRTILFLILTFSLCYQTFGQNISFYRTVKKQKPYYIEIAGEAAIVYKTGVYINKAGSGPAIIKTDTLIKNNENGFIGNTYSLVKACDNYFLKIENSKTLNTEILKDEKIAYLTLNNAYYLKSYFDMSDRIKKEFPLNHYTFRNGYSAWDRLSNKDYNHVEFRKNTDREIQTVYDSIFNIQTRINKTTGFIIENSKQSSYIILKDSLRTVPVDYISQSAYFDKAVYQIVESNPEHFYKLLQDFPAIKKHIYFAVEQDKELIKQLKQVQGYDNLKKDFFKDYRFGKSMPYKIIGTYAIIAGLITWLIIAQP